MLNPWIRRGYFVICLTCFAVAEAQSNMTDSDRIRQIIQKIEVAQERVLPQGSWICTPAGAGRPSRCWRKAPRSGFGQSL